MYYKYCSRESETLHITIVTQGTWTPRPDSYKAKHVEWYELAPFYCYYSMKHAPTYCLSTFPNVSEKNILECLLIILINNRDNTQEIVAILANKKCNCTLCIYTHVGMKKIMWHFAYHNHSWNIQLPSMRIIKLNNHGNQK